MKHEPIKRIKGTQDILPDEARLWQWMEQQAREVFAQWHYGEIRVPVIEYTKLFARGVGEETDIVSKEMFSFERSNRSLSLRPEGTAGVVRSYIEQGLVNAPKPLKLWYQGPMFRYERPQEGRQRQFHQLGVEVFGQDTAYIDAEVIALSARLFEKLGILGDVSLTVNNVGNPEHRPAFREALKQRLHPVLEELCEDCQRRYTTNPLRMLDCKVPTCQAHYNSEEITDFLTHYDWGDATTTAYRQTLELLSGMGLTFKTDPKLVRGLDYYSRTVFEWSTDKLGAQSAVCGGGRYNALVEQLGGAPTPAVGWAIGLERLLKLVTSPQTSPLDAYVVSFPETYSAAFKLANQLREAGLSVEQDSSGKAFGKQLQAANKRGASYALIVGVDEWANGEVTLKNLSTGEQKQYKPEEVNTLLFKE